ncbi:DNA-binding transcriptional regulator, Lrp family [Novosphingobium mathurense]|uniref:DNA-binding transcriptional regulator, Lrp family n=2 Tax=Novosphingobium mathurense TaxID=428990 RepID=A0A1U6HY50_9SPHN|nr:DNA-binding transcriptional regulator, Lrp family [Novosphingobium mathurense]
MDDLSDFDETDLRIVEQLRRNGRATHQQIAKALNLVPTTVSARIRRMEESGTLRVVAVSDFAVHGYHVLIHIGVEVSGRSPADVAEDLAQFQEVFAAYLVTGRYEVSILLALPNIEDLSQFIAKKFSKVEGIRSITQSIGLDIIKYGLDGREGAQ